MGKRKKKNMLKKYISNIITEELLSETFCSSLIFYWPALPDSYHLSTIRTKFFLHVQEKIWDE